MWQFGKSRPGVDGKRGPYMTLGAAPEFSRRHLDILRRVAENAAWRPDGGTPCRPAFACWPLGGDDWLLLRFLDDGLDDHFRPNTMRIEAALAEGIPWDAASGLLQPESWPEPAPDGEMAIVLSPVPPSDERPDRPAIPCLYGNGDELISPLFHSTAPCADRQGSPPLRTGKRRPVASMRPGDGRCSMPDRKATAWKWIAVFLILAQACSMVFIIRRNDEIDLLLQKISNAGEEVKDMKSRVSEWEKRNQEDRKIMTELRQTISELEKNSKDALSKNLAARYEGVVEHLSAVMGKLESLSKEIDDLRGPMRMLEENLKTDAAREEMDK